MEVATVKGQARQPGGRHANERLRRDGFVPAVIYGHGEAPETVAISMHDLSMALEHTQHVLKVAIDGNEQQYLLKEVQYDHLQKTPMHIDLMRVDPNERVHVRVSIETRGTPKGAAEGGVLVLTHGELHVEAPLLSIPEVIRVNVGEMALGDILHARDIELPEGVTGLDDPDMVVATVRLPRGVVEAEAAVVPGEGASAEPEVITKGKGEEEEGGA